MTPPPAEENEPFDSRAAPTTAPDEVPFDEADVDETPDSRATQIFEGLLE